MNRRFSLKVSSLGLVTCCAVSILARAGAGPNRPARLAPDAPTAKVGVLHSLTGTMAISEVSTPTFAVGASGRSEEHTSELQSRSDLVCRLLLEKKKKK